MDKNIKNRLEEIEYPIGGAKRVAEKVCDVIIENNLSLKEADIILDLAKDMLASQPLGSITLD